MNEALLAKWIWNLENSNGLWQTIIRHKYVKGRHIISIKKRQSDSHFWKGILEIRDKFYKYCKKKVGNGKSTSFWNNIWCDSEPLSTRYPNLFNIAYDKNITVEKALSSDFQLLTFRRRLLGDLASDHSNLIAQCNSTEIFNDDDDKTFGYWVIMVSLLKLFTEKTSALIYQCPPVFYGKPDYPTKSKFFVACSAQ
jgi:hypothetical protein